MQIKGLTTSAPQAVGLDPDALEDHRGRVREQLAAGIFPGQAECALVEGKLAYLDVAGKADKENGIPMRPTSLVRCFSMTKSFTAFGVTLLVEEGKLSFDDPVAKYIPSFKDTVVRRAGVEKGAKILATDAKKVEALKKPITMQHLLTHTSGLGYGPDRTARHNRLVARVPAHKPYRDLVAAVDRDEIPSLEAFCDALAGIPLQCQPGQEYIYSYGFDVAGRVIEVVSGQSLDCFLRRRLFVPLGMTRTGFSVARSDARSLLGLYTLIKEGSGPRELVRSDGEKPADSNWIAGKPTVRVHAGGGYLGSCSGGAVSCLQDLALFANMIAQAGVTLRGRQLFRPATMRLLRQDWLPRVASRPLKGWDDDGGESIGWTPIGMIEQTGEDPGAVYFGGRESYWWVEPRKCIAVVNITQVYWACTTLGYDEQRDDIKTVVQRASRLNATSSRATVKKAGSKKAAPARAATKKAASKVSPRKRPSPTSATADRPRKITRRA